MVLISAISLALTLAFCFAHLKLRIDALLTCAITFGTIAYHFCMRLLVGSVFDIFMHNKADYKKSFYQLKDWEKAIYKKIKVKKWKNKLPTYDPDLFDIKKHSPGEIVGAMCQAELVHECIAVLSLLPIGFSYFFGATAVFVISSVLGMLIDLSFVIVQRYNRPRVIRLIK